MAFLLIGHLRTIFEVIAMFLGWSCNRALLTAFVFIRSKSIIQVNVAGIKEKETDSYIWLWIASVQPILWD